VSTAEAIVAHRRGELTDDEFFLILLDNGRAQYRELLDALADA
jgi:L-lactate utilization protein LutB